MSTFEIPHSISYPYIERYDVYILLNIYELSNLKPHIRFRFWKSRNDWTPTCMFKDFYSILDVI